MAEVKVFRGIGAAIVRLKSWHEVTLAALVTDDGSDDVDTAQKFDVDLLKTPSQADPDDPECAWSEVECDNRGVDEKGKPAKYNIAGWVVPLGITTIGCPARPPLVQQSCFVGGIYLEDGFYKSQNFRSWPPEGYLLPQMTSLVYRASQKDPRAGQRYHGFVGTVASVEGTHITFLVGIERTKFVIDRNNPAQCDHDPPPSAFENIPATGYVTKLADAKKGDRLIAYVGLQYAVSEGGNGPKMPIGLEMGDGPAIRKPRVRS